MDIENFISYSKLHHLPVLSRLTLLYDGSLIKFFRAMYLTDISVEVRDQKEVSMVLEMAKFLDSTEGFKAIVRDAWLCRDGKRFVYAHTVIDASRVGETIKREIAKKSRPVGALLADYNIPIMRDQLFIAQIKGDYLAEHFSTIEDLFWVRCYRLRGADGFNAAILEVFSPDIWKTAS